MKINIPPADGYIRRYEAYRVRLYGEKSKEEKEDIAAAHGGIQKGEDIFVLTDEAKEMMEEDKKRYRDQPMTNELFENAKKEGENGLKEAKRFGAILEIFRRIARGDRVPGKDEKALIEYDMKLYMVAKNAGDLARNEKSKKHKSIIKKMEEEELRKKLEEVLRELDMGEAGEALMSFAKDQEHSITEIGEISLDEISKKGTSEPAIQRIDVTV